MSLYVADAADLTQLLHTADFDADADDDVFDMDDQTVPAALALPSTRSCVLRRPFDVSWHIGFILRLTSMSQIPAFCARLFRCRYTKLVVKLRGNAGNGFPLPFFEGGTPFP